MTGKSTTKALKIGLCNDCGTTEATRWDPANPAPGQIQRCGRCHQRHWSGKKPGLKFGKPMTDADKVIKGKKRAKKDASALQQIFIGGEDIWPKVSGSVQI